jgi:hypothetical protein
MIQCQPPPRMRASHVSTQPCSTHARQQARCPNQPSWPTFILDRDRRPHHPPPPTLVCFGVRPEPHDPSQWAAHPEHRDFHAPTFTSYRKPGHTMVTTSLVLAFFTSKAVELRRRAEATEADDSLGGRSEVGRRPLIQVMQAPRGCQPPRAPYPRSMCGAPSRPLGGSLACSATKRTCPCAAPCAAPRPGSDGRGIGLTEGISPPIAMGMLPLDGPPAPPPTGGTPARPPTLSPTFVSCRQRQQLLMSTQQATA